MKKNKQCAFKKHKLIKVILGGEKTKQIYRVFALKNLYRNKLGILPISASAFIEAKVPPYPPPFG